VDRLVIFFFFPPRPCSSHVTVVLSFFLVIASSDFGWFPPDSLVMRPCSLGPLDPPPSCEMCLRCGLVSIRANITGLPCILLQLPSGPPSEFSKLDFPNTDFPAAPTTSFLSLRFENLNTPPSYSPFSTTFPLTPLFPPAIFSFDIASLFFLRSLVEVAVGWFYSVLSLSFSFK